LVVEIPAEGVEPDEITKATMAQAEQLIDQKHTKRMMKLINKNKNGAKKYFQMLQKNGQANVHQYNTAIANLCRTSNEQRELISKMKTEGLHPDVVIFNTLINQLLYEGDKKAAQHVVDVEMPAEGVEPNEKTKATMAQADQLIGKKHTRQMMQLIKTNKNDAKKYFQMFQKNGQANVHHYNTAIANLCRTSNEQRELISKMKTEGLHPDLSTFTTLINQLLDEDDKKAAQHVVDVEMPAEGVEATNLNHYCRFLWV
jgi:hypothetical protein